MFKNVIIRGILVVLCFSTFIFAQAKNIPQEDAKKVEIIPKVEDIKKYVTKLLTLKEELIQKANGIDIQGRALTPKEIETVKILREKALVLERVIGFLKEKISKATPDGKVIFTQEEITKLQNAKEYFSDRRALPLEPPKKLEPPKAEVKKEEAKPDKDKAKKEANLLQIEAQCYKIKAALLRLEAKKLHLLLKKASLQEELKAIKEGKEPVKPKPSVNIGKPYIKNLHSYTVVATQFQGCYSQLPTKFKDLYTWAVQNKLEIVGPAVCTFLKYPPQYQEKDLLTEAAIIIKLPKVKIHDTKEFYIKKTKPCKVAVVDVEGPYAQAWEGCKALYTWINKTGLHPVGPIIEFYLDDPAKVPAEKCRTSICVPVETKYKKW